MPTDTRRLPLPERIFSLPLRENESDKPLVNMEGLRQDGREVDQLRPIFLKRGVISQAKGSAYIEMRRTKVIVAVYGPREVEKREDFSLSGRLNCEFKFATFSCSSSRGSHMPDNAAKEMAVIMTDALRPAICLHLYPKSAIELYVTVLEHDGAALSASLMASGVALADAGVEMYDVITACTVSVSGENLLTDPTRAEEEPTPEQIEADTSGVCRGQLTVSLLPQLDQQSSVTQRGRLTGPVLAKALVTCTAACRQLFPLVRHALTSRTSPQPEVSR